MLVYQIDCIDGQQTVPSISIIIGSGKKAGHPGHYGDFIVYKTNVNDANWNNLSYRAVGKMFLFFQSNEVKKLLRISLLFFN